VEDRFKGQEELRRAIYKYIVNRVADVITYGNKAMPIYTARPLEG
jgi:hypothetical protein